MGGRGSSSGIKAKGAGGGSGSSSATKQRSNGGGSPQLSPSLQYIMDKITSSKSYAYVGPTRETVFLDKKDADRPEMYDILYNRGFKPMNAAYTRWDRDITELPWFKTHSTVSGIIEKKR